LTWTARPRIAGKGPELKALWGDRIFGLGGSLSLFEGTYVTNSIVQGGFYAKERTSLDGFSFQGEARFSPNKWLYMEALAGLVSYHLRTEIDTNAPSFAYSGLLGNQTFGTFGFGGGLQTPWPWPVQAFVGARYLIAATSSASLEYGSGQVNAGFLWHFD
jgi:hypothetical protein